NIKQKKLIESSLDIYRWAIENGIAKELARNILPEGLTPSKLYMSNTLRGFIHWIQTRQGKDTQKEHREIAIKAKEIILKEIPSLKDILEDKKNE
ncbi:MAG: FAD-dependent thymidylate synthase, partial [Candidatus Paceibacterota bacterium]